MGLLYCQIHCLFLSHFSECEHLGIPSPEKNFKGWFCISLKVLPFEHQQILEESSVFLHKNRKKKKSVSISMDPLPLNNGAFYAEIIKTFK